MSRSSDIHPYVHSPPTIELAPPHKKHRKPSPSASLPVISPPASHHPTLPVAIPVTSNSLTAVAPTLPSADVMHSCPPLTTSRRTSTSSPHHAPVPVLYSLPEFTVGSLPHQRPSAWPVAMVNDFLTPSSNRSLSLSDPLSSSDDSDDQPLVFKMDD